MKSTGAILTVLFSGTLVAAACSSDSAGQATGNSGGTTQSSNGGASAGSSAVSTGGKGGQTPVSGGITSSGGNNSGGQTASPTGGSPAGGQTTSPTGGAPAGGQTSSPTAGKGSGGQTTSPTGGQTVKPSGGTGPGAGGAAAGGQTSTPPTPTGGIVPPSTGGSTQFAGEADFSMDPGWRFIKQDVTGADGKAFDDTGSTWSTVSTPHTYNDVDSYRVLNKHGAGDTGGYTGPAWYRKHFNIPSTYSGNKVIIEFMRIRQGAHFYLNGTDVGVYDDGVTPCGIDVTGKVNFGDGAANENVLAVKVDNSGGYKEVSTGQSFQWEGRNTNPNYGGLIGHVWLHLPGKIYQTYPLYNNLKTQGVYIYGSNYTNISNNTAQGDTGDLTLNVEAEVNNESGGAASATLGVKVVDPTTGTTLGTFQGTATSLGTTAATVIKASGPLTGAKLWSDLSPNLYNVVTTLNVGGKDVDGRTTTTGFRKAEFRGGAGKGGVWINGRFVFLLGYAQRSSNEWAGLGEAVPDWMHDYHANLIRGANSNYVRWMHISPQKQDVISHDRYGVVNVAPAGDSEGDAQGVQWTQRLNVMRGTMIYMRNSPSVFFWETGNSGVSAAHMKDMSDVQALWDPKEKGLRGLGDRDMEDSGGAQYAQWFGTMVAYDPSNLGSGYFRGYSDAYRDQGPIIEEEDFRDEAIRGIWDDYTPPHVGGFKPGPLDTYNETSESFTTLQVNRTNAWVNLENIHNTTPANSRYSAYGSIYFSDSDADGRLQSSSVARCSGKVDAVRIPKENYYSFRVIGNTQPDIHIIGHWTYPAGTKKTMYVLANTPSVELFVNGTSQGKSSKPTDTYTFSFASIAWATGSVKAVGYDASGKEVCSHEIKTAGPATAIKLTPTVGPNGFQADGADIAMFDVEVVDANGQRRPDDEARVDFAMTGPGIWRGGYNTTVLNSTNNTYLNTEAGINRVFIRSTLTAGDITLTATRTGLADGKATVTSKAVNVSGGLL